LGWCQFWVSSVEIAEDFHSGELGLSDAKYPDLAAWKSSNDSPDSGFGPFPCRVVSAVDRELEHGESFVEEEVPEPDVMPFLGFGDHW